MNIKDKVALGFCKVGLYILRKNKFNNKPKTEKVQTAMGVKYRTVPQDFASTYYFPRTALSLIIQSHCLKPKQENPPVGKMNHVDGEKLGEIIHPLVKYDLLVEEERAKHIANYNGNTIRIFNAPDRFSDAPDAINKKL
jgi:hypothetical protein